LILLLAAAAAGIHQTAVAAPKRTPPPRIIDSFGRWSLAKLGYEQLRIGSAGPRKAAVRYRLLEGASQGPDRWYLLHLHFRMTVHANRAGVIYLFADTNGRSTAQLRFAITRDSKSGIRITESALGLIGGQTTTTTRGARHEGRFSNYLQKLGVKPGDNQLSFTFKKFRGDAEVTIDILPDTALEYSRRRPPELRLTAKVDRSAIRPGEQFTVSYKIRNLGGYEARHIRVIPGSGPGVRRIGQVQQHKAITSGQAVQGETSFVAGEEGRSFVTLAVEGHVSQPLARIDFAVRRRGTGFARYSLAVIIAAISLAGIAVWVFRRKAET
jgi:hypothetical protein